MAFDHETREGKVGNARRQDEVWDHGGTIGRRYRRLNASGALALLAVATGMVKVDSSDIHDEREMVTVYHCCCYSEQTSVPNYELETQNAGTSDVGIAVT